MAGFTGLTVASLTMQFLIAMGQMHLWVRRERKRVEKDAAAAKKKLFCHRRLPIIPALSSLTLAAMLVTYPLVGLNIMNPANGVGVSMSGFILVSFGIMNFLLLLKVVALGYNIISPSKRQSKRTNQHLDAARQAQLRKFDTRGKIVIAIGLVSMAGAVVSCCIFGLILPGK
jgi:hypothetical protein